METPKIQPGKLLQEFKAFAMKGNVIDLAVAVVIGGAFGKIVTSIVSDIIMPLVGLISGGFNVSAAQLILRAAEGDKPALILHYGSFCQSVIDFVIIAASIFVMLKILLAARIKQEAKPAEPPAKAPELAVLEEIRDLLKK